MDNKANTASAASSRQELSLEQITLKEGRSKREKCLIGVSIVLFILLVVFLALFIVYYLKYEDKEKDKDKEHEMKEKVCNSVECLHTASALSEVMDTKVNPCDDFYEFACGKWVEKNPPPPGITHWELFQQLRKKLGLEQRALLEQQDPTAPDAIQKARAFYSACVHTVPLGLFNPQVDQKNKDCLTGTAPWLNLFKSRGDNVFPTMDGNSWVDENWTFNEILERIPRKPDLNKPVMSYGQPFIEFAVNADGYNSVENALYFTQTADYDTNRYQFLGDRNSPELQSRQTTYAILVASMGADASTALQDAKEVVDFEVLVAQAAMKAPIDIKTHYQKMTLRQLTEKYPQFDWLKYVQDQFSTVDMTVTLDEDVVTDSLDYFDNIFDVINSTSRRTVLNYCWWSVIQAYVTVVPHSNNKDIQTSCATATNFYFPDVLGRLYVDKHFPEATRRKVEDLTVDLKNAFKDIVRETDWMSEETKQTAKEKVDAMIDKVGYPDDLKDDAFLNEKTKDFNMTQTDFLAIAVNIGDTLMKANLRRLTMSNNREKTVTRAAEVNAFYNPLTNSIIFPAGILQKPAYSETAVHPLIYGGVGFFIGHEITHGFDNTGALFDKTGNIKNWWQPEDLREFEKRGECMVEQYSKYHYPEVNMSVNGRITLGENIADNGALKESYLAYKKMLARTKKDDPKLPLLDYTPEQLFFIGSAQFWCVYSHESVLPILLQDAHTPNKYRVIGPMQNSEDFAKAFNCPVGSYMNPEKKCHVW